MKAIVERAMNGYVVKESSPANAVNMLLGNTKDVPKHIAKDEKELGEILKRILG